MARDMVKMNKYNNEWKKNNTKGFTVRFTNTSRIPAGLKTVAEKYGISETMVIRQAIMEKLQREGYDVKGDKE